MALRSKRIGASQRLSRIKVGVFLLGIIGLFGAVVARAVELQVMNHDEYQELAQSQHFREYALQGERGEIFFRDLKTGGLFPVAINRTLYDIAIDPKMLAGQSEEHNLNLKQSFQNLIEGFDSADFDRKRAKTNDQWELIARDIPEETVQELQAQGFKGVVYEDKKERYYPEKNLASQVIGYVRRDDLRSGQYGVEQSYNDILRGEDGFERKESDTRGTWLALTERERQDAQEGADLVLTLDHTIQFKLEEVLTRLDEQFNAKSVMGAIMNPDTGDIYAMGSSPSFDPNEYNKVEDIQVFRNPFVSNVYEPGSVFKPFTVGLGLEYDVITPDSTYVDTGEVTLNGFTIKNSLEKVHGEQTMTYALDFSLNTGMVHIQQLLGRQRFTTGLIEAFGMEEKTGIDLPGEGQPNFANIQKDPRDARDVNYATASFGQGVSTTPIKMLTAFSSIVNDGVMMKPRVVKEIRYPDGTVEERAPEEVRQVLSKEAAGELAAMLVSVVDNGHGKKAGIEGYSIGGKTGTAQIASIGGYGDDTFQSFIQFATLEDTRYTLLISIDSPQGARFSDQSVVPATRELNEFLVNYFEIEPDTLDQNKQDEANSD